MSRKAATTVLAAGVILPLVTIGVELTTGWCAEILFDPLPSWGHVLFALCVPLGNGFARSTRPAAASACCGPGSTSA